MDEPHVTKGTVWLGGMLWRCVMMVLWCYDDVLWWYCGGVMLMLWWCYDVTMMLWWCYDCVTMMLWCYNDVMMVLRWCFNDDVMKMLWWWCDDVTMMLRWCYDDGMMMVWWCYDDVMMISRWCYDDVTYDDVVVNLLFNYSYGVWAFRTRDPLVPRWTKGLWASVFWCYDRSLPIPFASLRKLRIKREKRNRGRGSLPASDPGSPQQNKTKMWPALPQLWPLTCRVLQGLQCAAQVPFTV